MSQHDSPDPVCTEQSDSIAVIIRPKSRDLGGFSVKRVLPASLARRVGPFVFFDEMGPAQFPPGQGINVRPHPHIGLATVTFLFDGEIMHRDSLGYVQPIQPGAVNLMTAGTGITHSERTSEQRLADGQRLHGIQVWMALPADMQAIEPAFVHYPADQLPTIEKDGVMTTVIIGEYAGTTSPVAVHANTLYLFQQMRAGSQQLLDVPAEQRAVYLVSGAVAVDGVELQPGDMAVLANSSVTLAASEDTRLMIIGGEDVGHRELVWNFVHTDAAMIEKAKQQWRAGEFPMVPDDDEFIPLPDHL